MFVLGVYFNVGCFTVLRYRLWHSTILHDLTFFLPYFVIVISPAFVTYLYFRRVTVATQSTGTTFLIQGILCIVIVRPAAVGQTVSTGRYAHSSDTTYSTVLNHAIEKNRYYVTYPATCNTF